MGPQLSMHPTTGLYLVASVFAVCSMIAKADAFVAPVSRNCAPKLVKTMKPTSCVPLSNCSGDRPWVRLKAFDDHHDAPGNPSVLL